MKVRALIQARMGSTRLKGKTLMFLAGVPLLGRVINSVNKLDFVDEIVIATTDLCEDDPIVDFANSNQVKFFRGSSLDVLARFIHASKDLDANDCIVRVTADNLFNNHKVTKKVFELHRENRNDYTCIEGLSHVVNEFIQVGSLRSVYSYNELNDFDREHVTPFFRMNKHLFKVQELPSNFLGLRADLDKLLTMDTITDFARIEKMAQGIDIDKAVDFSKVYAWLLTNK